MRDSINISTLFIGRKESSDAKRDSVSRKESSQQSTRIPSQSSSQSLLSNLSSRQADIKTEDSSVLSKSKIEDYKADNKVWNIPTLVVLHVIV